MNISEIVEIYNTSIKISNNYDLISEEFLFRDEYLIDYNQPEIFIKIKKIDKLKKIIVFKVDNINSLDYVVDKICYTMKERIISGGTKTYQTVGKILNEWEINSHKFIKNNRTASSDYYYYAPDVLSDEEYGNYSSIFISLGSNIIKIFASEYMGRYGIHTYSDKDIISKRINSLPRWLDSHIKYIDSDKFKKRVINIITKYNFTRKFEAAKKLQE